ncbi:hypothetical protein M569_04112, partial [Genlisea aurea]
SSSSSPPSSIYDSNEDLQRLERAPPFWRNRNPRRRLSKQLSMCEIPRNLAWERRRRQFLRQERRRNGINKESDLLTDEDLNELKGCIELGFGFDEENGQSLCSTIPALDLYFAVNRQFASSPVSSPNSNTSASASLGARSSSVGSPGTGDSDAWKIFHPGEDPQHIKTKLRHWAQAVACSLRQSS